jgi:hypothetical protein
MKNRMIKLFATLALGAALLPALASANCNYGCGQPNCCVDVVVPQPVVVIQKGG